MRKKYEWRILTNDGLLKEPKPYGPYYDQKELNGYGGGFETVEEAEQALVEWEKDAFSSDDFVLMQVYRTN